MRVGGKVGKLIFEIDQVFPATNELNIESTKVMGVRNISNHGHRPKSERVKRTIPLFSFGLSFVHVARSSSFRR